MLVRPEPVCRDDGKKEADGLSPAAFASAAGTRNDFVSGVLDEYIGRINQGETKHFYSFGNFNSMRLIFHILKTTGPASILMSSYGISPKTIAGILGRMEKGVIKDFRLIVDNRVRSISPRPFDMIGRSFNYRCASIHAKVACIWNDAWKVTLISSQNATDNPKAERGIIYTDPADFDFDHKNLSDVFNRGTT
jgi:hypothetical protein